jgi:hypothetical protein
MEDAPKSAVELAMERLRKKDAESGTSERPLSDDQKVEIADVRQVYAAKLAQTEILHKSRLASMLDPQERAKADEEYRRDLQRLNEEREAKLDSVRRRPPPE